MQEQLAEGNHTVIISEVSPTYRIGNVITRFTIKYTNHNGYIFQSFYQNEFDKAKLKNFLHKMGIEGMQQHDANILRALQSLLGKELSIIIYRNDRKYLDVMGWEPFKPFSF